MIGIKKLKALGYKRIGTMTNKIVYVYEFEQSNFSPTTYQFLEFYPSISYSLGYFKSYRLARGKELPAYLTFKELFLATIILFELNLERRKNESRLRSKVRQS